MREHDRVERRGIARRHLRERAHERARAGIDVDVGPVSLEPEAARRANLFGDDPARAAGAQEAQRDHVCAVRSISPEPPPGGERLADMLSAPEAFMAVANATAAIVQKAAAVRHVSRPRHRCTRRARAPRPHRRRAQRRRRVGGPRRGHGQRGAPAGLSRAADLRRARPVHVCRRDNDPLQRQRQAARRGHAHHQHPSAPLRNRAVQCRRDLAKHQRLRRQLRARRNAGARAPPPRAQRADEGTALAARRVVRPATLVPTRVVWAGENTSSSTRTTGPSKATGCCRRSPHPRPSTPRCGWDACRWRSAGPTIATPSARRRPIRASPRPYRQPRPHPQPRPRHPSRGPRSRGLPGGRDSGSAI